VRDYRQQQKATAYSRAVAAPVPAEHVTGAAYPEEEKSAKRRINPTAEERSVPPLCVCIREEIQIDQESER